jgi:hypothetical protein
VVIDLVAVLVFVAIGRSVHAHGVSVDGMASTSWPFLGGLAVGWVVALGARRPVASLAGGVVAWPATVAVGMVLRVVAGQGTAFPFILVALAFLGLCMLGGRLALLGLARLAARSR